MIVFLSPRNGGANPFRTLFSFFFSSALSFPLVLFIAPASASPDPRSFCEKGVVGDRAISTFFSILPSSVFFYNTLFLPLPVVTLTPVVVVEHL